MGIDDGQLHFCKQVGTIDALTTAWNSRPPAHLGLAIGHTRWATHGKPSYENAHPHFDEKFNIAVVHNGIIENHNSLRDMLKSYEISFETDTDTEVIAKLIAYFYEGDLLTSVRKALSLMHGFWALAVIHKSHPDIIVAAARENPLIIAQHQRKQETYISSDPNAFHLPDLDLIFLRNDEIALIKSTSVEIFDESHHPVVKTTERMILDNETQSKGSFDHFMQKEIFEQPKTIQQALHNRFIEEFGTVEFENFNFTPQELLAVKRIVILGCGTSWHAASIGALLLEEKARIPAQAEIASEFRYKNPIITEDTLVIAISQSGETLDTIAAVREVQRKGAKVIGICNVRKFHLSKRS
ncbi:MAG: SIS domain-containing protein [Rhabdochlamydiaceae bacterium]